MPVIYKLRSQQQLLYPNLVQDESYQPVKLITETRRIGHTESLMVSYCRHSFPQIASRMFPGDIGNWFILTPVAWWMALAIAAIGGTIGTSPTPLTPYGWVGLATSTITVSSIGKSRLVGIR